MTPNHNASPTPTRQAPRHISVAPRLLPRKYLAKARLNRRQRARLAAELAKGTAQVSPLTIKQAAALARVPALEVSKACRNARPRGNSNKRANGHVETL